MDIQFTTQDVETAMRAYIANQGIVTEGKSIDLKFVMGRKGKGLTVTASIEPVSVPLQAVETAEVASTGETEATPESGSLFNS